MSTRFHLDSDSWNTVVDMINWTLMDLAGHDAEDEEEAEELRHFESDIRELASKMGLKNVKGKNNGTAT